MESTPNPNTGRARILVVDDNVDGAASVAALLELSGHETAIAHSGPQAIERLQTFSPTWVILDIGLPGMDGYEVARAMRAHPNAAGAVLVALTGWGAEEDVRRAREAGFDHHFTKPLQLEKLMELIRSPHGESPSL